MKTLKKIYKNYKLITNKVNKLYLSNLKKNQLKI